MIVSERLGLFLSLGVYHSYANWFGRDFDLDARLRFRDLPGILLTFHVVMISWVFFRAPSVEKAVIMLGSVIIPDDTDRLPQLSSEDFTAGVMTMCFVFALHVLRGMGVGRHIAKQRSPVLVGVLWGFLIVFMILMQAPTGSRFIYFQF